MPELFNYIVNLNQKKNSFEYRFAKFLRTSIFTEHLRWLLQVILGNKIGNGKRYTAVPQALLLRILLSVSFFFYFLVF